MLGNEGHGLTWAQARLLQGSGRGSIALRDNIMVVELHHNGMLNDAVRVQLYANNLREQVSGK